MIVNVSNSSLDSDYYSRGQSVINSTGIMTRASASRSIGTAGEAGGGGSIDSSGGVIKKKVSSKKKSEVVLIIHPL